MEQKIVQKFAKTYGINGTEAKEIVKTLEYLPHHYRKEVSDLTARTDYVVANVRFAKTKNYKVLRALLELASANKELAKEMFVSKNNRKNKSNHKINN